ncbi:hypothetical protein FKW77_004258 [Venturia effusa]|uniref:Pectate lyase superfamily protein domain-containing protein n=1 Tax=Venturia effusa TaxID=50376 RepID=A0A517LMP1_9PEZI|nr:hypothetical protein FKW77_004258 [Venturia effusa]
MYGLKQLLVLALAGSAFACQCRVGGKKDGALDVAATQIACQNTPGGAIYNGGTYQVTASHHYLAGVLELATPHSTRRVKAPLVNSLAIRTCYRLVEGTELTVNEIEREEMVQAKMTGVFGEQEDKSVASCVESGE